MVPAALLDLIGQEFAQLRASCTLISNTRKNSEQVTLESGK